MKIPFADLHIQYVKLKNEIDAAINNVIQDLAFVGGYNNKYVRSFEENFAKFLDIKYCVGCANGTDAIEIALKALGVGTGDEVIVPAISWISTSEAVSAVGAKPVFVDISKSDCTIDIRKIEEKINKKTKAIIPVHLYGFSADMDAIMQLAKKYSLLVIEDSAQAHGTEYKGKKVGTIGHIGTFSFYPGKNLGAYGDAGCLVTNDDKIMNKARMIANHGQIVKHQHEIEGRNSRLDGLQAAILDVKLRYLDEWNQLRRKNAEIYDSLFRNTKIEIFKAQTGTVPVYHLYVVKVKEREGIEKILKENNIEFGIHYPTPLPFLKAYSYLNHSTADFPVADEVSKKIISLPMFPELSKEDIVRIGNMICK